MLFCREEFDMNLIQVVNPPYNWSFNIFYINPVKVRGEYVLPPLNVVQGVKFNDAQILLGHTLLRHTFLFIVYLICGRIYILPIVLL